MSTISWHLIQNGAQKGVFGDAELRQMAADGRLAPGDMVWREGMTQWATAGSLNGLFPASAPPPIQPPAMNYYAPPPPGYRAQGDMGQDAGMRLLLPIGRSGWAIAAGYLGLFSVCGVTAPFAIACAIMAFIDMRKHPEKHGMGRAIFGLIMGVLGCGMLVGGIVSRVGRP